MNKQKQAFTLVELIVTITILLVLGAIGFVSYMGYITTAKDSKVVSELDNLQVSIENYQIKNGKLPNPDDYKEITYLDTLVWKQGILGKGVVSSLSYSKEEVLEPKTNSFYTYSVKNTGKEYSLAGILENQEIALSNIFSSNVSADGEKEATAIVVGNYNGVLTSISTGGVDYILNVPSIIASDLSSTKLTDIIANNRLVYNGYTNLPASFQNTEYKVFNQIDFYPKEIIVFSGSMSELSNEEERVSLLYSIQKTYSGTMSNNGANNSLSTLNNNQIDLIYPSKNNRFLAYNLVNSVLNYNIDYDNTNFTAFYVIENPELLNNIDFEGLPGVQVNYIYQDGDYLWFGTENGPAKYYTTDGTWTNYPGTEGYKITTIVKDKDGNMWFGTSDTGLLKYDGANFVNYQSNFDFVDGMGLSIETNTTDGLPSNAVYDIVVTDDGKLIIGTHNGGSYFDPDTNIFEDFYIKSGWGAYLKKENRMKNLLIDSNGYLWFGTDKGAYLYEGDLDSIKDTSDSDFTFFNGYNGLPYIGTKQNIKVRNVFEDSDHNMWFGTDKGIAELGEADTYIPLNKYNTYSGEGLSSNNIKTIFQDSNTSNMWFGTDSGVSVFSGSTFTNYTKDVNGADLGTVFFIYQDDNGLNILGTSNGSTTLE